MAEPVRDQKALNIKPLILISAKNM